MLNHPPPFSFTFAVVNIYNIYADHKKNRIVADLMISFVFFRMREWFESSPNDNLHDNLHFLVLEMAITCVIGHVCG